MSSEGEETILMIGNVKYKKKDGSIVMTRSRFAWSREGTSELLVNIPYTGIKSHKVSKEGSSKIQLQLVLPSEETMNFHFTGSDPKRDRSQVSDLLVQCISKSNAIQTNPEMEAKWKLLQDADLYRLYKDMVVSGVITAEEFWANRWIPNQEQQQSGLPSAFLIDIETVSGCNTVQYQLSTDVIENIFRTYPSVKERHSQLVPDKLSEEKFWVQFFQSHKFHQNLLTSHKAGQSSNSSSNSSGLFQECFEQDITAINSRPSVSSGPSLVQVPDNPLEDTPEDISLQVNKQLIQRCNQHSALVLNAIQSDNNQLGSHIKGSTSDELLQLAMCPSTVVADTSPTELINIARQYLHDISQEQQNEVISPSDAQSASRHLLMGGSLIGVASTPPSSISPLVLESLCRYQRSLGELLRHFWACFPVVNSQLELKMHRMIQCLHDFKEKQLLIEFKSQLTSDTELSLLDQLLVTIETATTRYQDWTSKQLKTQ